MSKSVEQIIMTMVENGESFCNSSEFAEIAKAVSVQECRKLLRLINGESKVSVGTYIALLQLVGDIHQSGVKGVDNGLVGDIVEAFFRADTSKNKRTANGVSSKIGIDFIRHGYKVECKHNSGELNNILQSDVILYAYSFTPYRGITAEEVREAFRLYRTESFWDVVKTEKRCGRKISSYIGYSNSTDGSKVVYRIRKNLGHAKAEALAEDLNRIEIDKNLIYA